MSTLVSSKAGILSVHPLHTAIRNTEGIASDNELVELSTDDLWRLDGDHRWRMIICTRGEVWITQERDVRDYVLTAGDMFVVSQPGSVLIEALSDAAVEITPCLKSTPYRGDYPIFD